jgi:hypothetical protein
MNLPLRTQASKVNSNYVSPYSQRPHHEPTEEELEAIKLKQEEEERLRLEEEDRDPELDLVVQDFQKKFNYS